MRVVDLSLERAMALFNRPFLLYSFKICERSILGAGVIQQLLDQGAQQTGGQAAARLLCQKAAIR
jgi:hypothetical protein